MTRRARWGTLLLTAALAACGQPAPAFKPPPAGSFAVQTSQSNLGGGTTLQGALVTKEFFPATGAQPLLGRFFTDADFAQGAPSVIILSNKLWADRLNSSPALIGKTIEIDGNRATIVGVAAKGFDLPVGTAFWAPKKS